MDTNPRLPGGVSSTAPERPGRRQLSLRSIHGMARRATPDAEPAVVMRRVGATRVRLIRRSSTTQIAHDGDRRLWLVLSGRGTVSGHPFGAGETVAFAPYETASVWWEREGDHIEIASNADIASWPLTTTVLPPSTPAVLLRAMAVSILSTMAIPPRDRGAVALTLHTATTAVLLSASANPPADLIGRAEGLVHEHAHDPLFSVAALADMLHVSRRHLTRALAASGRSPRQCIRDVRLDRARTLQQAYGHAVMRDDSLARACGFSSARALRETRQAVDRR